VAGVAIAGSSPVALLGQRDGRIHLCDLMTGYGVREWNLATSAKYGSAAIGIWSPAVALTRNASRALTSSLDGRVVSLWDTQNEVELVRYRHEEDVRVVRFSADERYALVGCIDGSVHMWALRD